MNVTGEYSRDWAYSNADGYANFSIGHGNDAWNAADIFSLGVTKLIPPGTAVGSLLQPWLGTGNVQRAWQSPKKNEANTLNSIDPKKKFPIKDTSNCDEVNAVKGAVQAEQTAVGGTAASGYKGALVAYHSYLDQLLIYNECTKKAADKAAADKIQNDTLAAKAALDIANAQKQIQSIATGGTISPVTIGLVVGGVILTGIIIMIVRK